jgi:hypothetical protein
MLFRYVLVVPVTTGVEVVGGDAVTVKRASGGGAAVEGLRREGERLRHAAHPGVVSVVRSAVAGDGWELVLAHGGRALSTLRRPSPVQVAAIAAGVASTLADLHAIGIVHGRIDASHVLISEGGRPRLCGFGDGISAASPDDDVAALGALIEEILGRDEEPEPIPERRWGRRGRWNGWERRALLTLADQATTDSPSRRPTARRLAAAITEAVPTTERDQPVVENQTDAVDWIERVRPAATDGDAAGPSRAPAIGLAMVGLVLAVVALARLRSTDQAQVVPNPVRSTSADVQVAEPASDGMVVAHGKRYRVGQEGDHLLVGDWRCEGEPTPAVFRPSTHEVFVFDRWTATEPLAVDATDTVADAVELVTALDRDGCPTLSVRTERGDVVPIALGDVR